MRLIIFTLLLSPSVLWAADNSLVLLTWEDYIDPEIVTEFEQKNDVTLRFVYYEDDDARDLIMANSNAIGFDLIVVDETMLESYQQQQWLHGIATQKLPNLKLIEHPKDKQPLPDISFSVPYFWGTVGILYYPDQFPKPVTSWLDYFRAPENLKSKLLALNTAQTMFGIGLKALGYSVNSTSSSELDRVTTLLNQHRPYVKAYRNVLFDENEPLLKGELAAALVYNGDALTLMEMNDQLRYVVPSEGSIFWYDSWAILERSSQKALAMKFLDFINQPEINARNAEFVSYATPNKGAVKFLSEEHLSNLVSYPAPNVIQQLELSKQLPPKVMKRIHSDFVSITRSVNTSP